MSTSQTTSQNIKGKVLRGGIALTLRRILVTPLSLANVLVVARILGPERYGIITIALGIIYFLGRTCRMGLHIYLIRQPDSSKKTSEEILAFYNTVGIAICVLLWFAAPALGWWTGKSATTEVFRWLLPAVWLDSVSRVFISQLERELNFTRVGLIEALGMGVNYLSAIALVLMGWGYWGPIAGTVLGFDVQAGLGAFSYPLAWRWRWHWSVLRPALAYGLTYSGSDWILELRLLRIPILVSRLVSVEAAGLINIAFRMAHQLSMLRLVVRRMSISVMAKLLDAPDRIRRAIGQGMAYQALTIGPVCAAFSCCAAWLIPLMFSSEWLVSAKIFPFIAFGILVSSIFDLHSSTLYAAGRNREVAKVNFAYVGILWLVSVALLPSLGVWGYGIAEVMALAGYVVIHRSLSKLYGSPNYSKAVWLIAATIFPLFGGVFLSPVWAIVVFIASYGLVFLLNSKLRKLPMELLSARKSPKSA